MPEPLPKPRRKWLLPLCAAAVLLLLLAVSLPLQVEHFFLPRLLESTGLAGYRVAVSRFGPRGCTLHLASAPENAFLSAGTLRLDWTVTGLLRGRLQRLAGDGLLVNAAVPPPRLPAKDPADDGTGTIPLRINRIELRNSFIALPRTGSSFLLPLSLSGQLQEEAASPDSPLQYKLSLHAAAQELHADITLDQGGLYAGTGQATLDLPALAANLPMPDLGEYQGSARLAVEFAGTLSPFRLATITGSARVSDFQADFGRIGLRAAGADDAQVTFSGGNGTYRINGANLTLAGPLTAGLAFTGEIVPESGAITWQGDFTLQPAAGQQLAGQVRLDKAPALHLHHEGRFEAGGFEINLRAGPPEGQKQDPLLFRLRDSKVQADGLTAEARIRVSPENADQWLTATYSIKSSLATDFARGQGRVPVVALRGSATLPAASAGPGPALEGRFELSDGALELVSPELSLQGVHLALPFAWPGSEQNSPGKLRIKDISMGQFRLGGFSGAISQEEDVFFLQGEAGTTLLPDDPIKVTAKVQPFRPQGPLAESSWSAKQARLAVQELAPLHPSLQSLTGTAVLDLAGNLRFDQCGLQGDLTAGMQGGNFGLPEAQLSLDDVVLDLRLPRLPELETAPAQHLAIGAIRSKKIAITDLNTDFRIESPDSLFIENISAGWSGGRVFSSGLRLHKDLAELEFALFGDRLQLAEILSQLGLAEATGVGVVSGRIPLHYRDQQIKVDDGFLFTSPGDRGTLQITRSDHLNVGLPLDAPQFSPLHFAGAALGDFEYNWAKLNVFSEEENLLLKLQIDGKPRERLPYRFDAKNNVFVRLPEGAAGGIDQPIKLDVNFRVPVNELLRNQQILLPLLRNLK